MRKALCVGINYYVGCNCLKACVNDAIGVAAAFESHYDGTPNFETALLCAQNQETAVCASDLRYAVRELFKGSPEIALFYYSGHGVLNSLGGYLCTSEIANPEDGMSLDELMGIAAQSKAKYKIIILDSCHSGAVGNIHSMANFSLLPEGTTLLAACADNDYAIERGGHGVFTSLFLQALRGDAMNILGEVTTAGIYSYIDRLLGAYEQRPIFKANIDNFVCIRKNAPSIPLPRLRLIHKLFPEQNYVFPLDPSYEEDKRDAKTEEDKIKNEEHEQIFDILRDYAALNLVEPVGEKRMYQAAVNSKSCRLTSLGQQYWKLSYRRKF